MQGTKHLFSARRSKMPMDQKTEDAQDTQQPPRASSVPPVDVLQAMQPAPEPAPPMERRSALNTRINGALMNEPEAARPYSDPTVAAPSTQHPPTNDPADVAPPWAHHPAAPWPEPVPQAYAQAPQDHAPSPPPAAHHAAGASVPPPDYPVSRPQSAPQGVDGPSRRRSTRLLGFSSEEAAPDVFGMEAAPVEEIVPRYPVGWLVVLEGPGQGMSYTVTPGLTTIGRDASQTISLDHGDDSISREQHVAIAYDEDENRTYVGHGGKRNIVRLNGKPLLTTEELADGDQIKLGKTVLYFVAMCGEGFAWKDVTGGGEAHGEHGS